MLPDVALQCDVQRLFTHSDLTLAVGVHPVFESPAFGKDDRRWVLPWEWKSVDFVYVSVDLGDATVVQPLDLTTKPPEEAKAAAKAALNKRADDLWDSAKQAAFSLAIKNPDAPPPAAGHVL